MSRFHREEQQQQQDRSKLHHLCLDHTVSSHECLSLSGFNMLSGNPDLSLLDPAIVSGQISSSGGLPLNLRSDSPLSNTWMRGGMEQQQQQHPFGADGGGNSNGFNKCPLPGFSGLSISGQQQQRWSSEGRSSASSEMAHPPPPPGFSMNRLQQPQQSFQSLSMNSEGAQHHQIENKGYF